MPPTENKLSDRRLLAIAYLGFVSLGLPDSIAGVAWPSIRSSFHLPQGSFGLIFIGLGSGYCTSGFFGGKLTQSLGLGHLLWISSGLVGIGMICIGFSPAWPMIVACSFIWGLGSGGIDTGLNSYASNYFSPLHMNWMHACYSLGATFGPLMMTAMIVRFTSWRIGYEIVGFLLLAMTVVFFLTREQWHTPSFDPEKRSNQNIDMITVLRDPVVQLQVLLFFLYVGVEFTVGQWCYSLLSESRGVRPDIAGILSGSFYAAIGIGRILAGAFAQQIGIDRLLRFAIGMLLSGSVLFASVYRIEGCAIGLMMIGLGLAPIFPCLMTRTPQRLGADYSVHAIGFQASAGMIGGATVPAFAGLIAESYGLQMITLFVISTSVLLVMTHELLIAKSHIRSARFPAVDGFSTGGNFNRRRQ